MLGCLLRASCVCCVAPLPFFDLGTCLNRPSRVKKCLLLLLCRYIQYATSVNACLPCSLEKNVLCPSRPIPSLSPIIHEEDRTDVRGSAGSLRLPSAVYLTLVVLPGRPCSSKSSKLNLDLDLPTLLQQGIKGGLIQARIWPLHPTKSPPFPILPCTPRLQPQRTKGI